MKQVPELEEVFSIRLVNATGGATITTSGSQVATITVQASDHPYGLFTFSSAFRPLMVDENVGEVEVTVTREFGNMGSVTVSYTTVQSGHSSLEGLVDIVQLEQDRYSYISSVYTWYQPQDSINIVTFLQSIGRSWRRLYPHFWYTDFCH